MFMHIACFRFYGELNDFLAKERRNKSFQFEFRGNPSVKDAIESMGVPHVETDLVLVNSCSVDFSYNLKNEDYVSVYPVFESFDIGSVTHLREIPLRDVKFVADVHLGKLTKYLRLCGFDTFYETNLTDSEIIEISLSQGRAIITRDIGLLKNKKVTHGFWLRSQEPRMQLREVFTRFDIKKPKALFTRCMECNGLLRDTAKDEILDRLLPMTRRYYRKFKICDRCFRIYWNGSHYRNMKKDIKTLFHDFGKGSFENK
jgi:uncharacterized protein